MALEGKLEQKTRISYSDEEVSASALEYFNGDALSANVWKNKYALKDSNDNLYEKSPAEMHSRLAKEFARIESKYQNPMSEDKIYSLLENFKYIVPAGSPMSGIGNNYQVVSLSNCFVIGNEGESDSYGGIMKIDQEQVQLMKRRGGVGHDLSHIRPKKTAVENSALTSTGIVPFMDRYSNSTREVAQDGRRGALMLSVAMKHPDVEDFIDAKMTPGRVTGANVSVKIDDEFMKAVINGEKYMQQYPIDSANPQVEKEVDAKNIWNKIVHNAHQSAEPGILFWDTITRESIPDRYADLGYKTISTNPCGEIPLCADDSCRLLSLNLYSYVENPFTKEASFNYNLFKEHAGYGQRMMDDIIDLEVEKVDSILNKIDRDPEAEEIKGIEKKLWERIKHKSLEGRRTGLGITGEGDMLAAMGLTYGSDEGIAFSTEVHKTLAIEAYRSSVEMAKERGAFDIYDSKREEGNPFIERIKEADPALYKDMEEYGRRNISLLTIAPTGSLSMMTQTTSGIEPIFQPAYKRRKKINPTDKNAVVSFTDEVGDVWEEFNVFHHKFETWLDVNGYNVGDVKKMNDGDLDDIVKQSPYHKATSNDIDWVKKIKMQGDIQKWVDHSISVTVNLPEDTTEEIVDNVYRAAWEVGCKGVTVYRDGSREGVLLTGKEEKKEKGFPKKRPKSLEAEVLKFKNTISSGETEEWIAFVGLVDGKPYEIFTGKSNEDVLAVPNSVTNGQIVKEENGSSHYDFHYLTSHGFESVIGGISHQFNKTLWNYAKMTSGMLRNEMPLVDIVDIVGRLDEGEEGIHSWKNGFIRALKKYIPDGAESSESCPDCNMNYHYEEGCKACGCGSKCD